MRAASNRRRSSISLIGPVLLCTLVYALIGCGGGEVEDEGAGAGEPATGTLLICDNAPRENPDAPFFPRPACGYFGPPGQPPPDGRKSIPPEPSREHAQ